VRKFVLFLLSFAFLLLPKPALAQGEAYVINNFNSEITINQDSSITVAETIEVYFNEERHGIFRNIPVVYRTEDRVINSKLNVISVVDENGRKYKYETSRSGDGIQIKIGDGDVYVEGLKTYVITYRARNIIQRYQDYDELYWNVAGDGWDASILSAQATVKSEFATIDNIQCFSGLVGVDTKCESLAHDGNSAEFASGTVLGNGSDMTIVVGLDDDNSLIFATTNRDIISDYWGYPIAIVPFLIMFYFWFKRGRDSRYKSDNIYYTPNNKNTENTPVFGKREFIPTVYGPIAGLTPAEVGTLVDERVDIHDVVAELVELGRLGYLKIEKIDKRFAKDDYVIKKIKDSDNNLRDYQKYLHESIFSFVENGEVRLSELKKKFYTKLEKFRDKLYTHLDERKYFDARPDKVRIKWFVIAGVLETVVFIAVISFISINYDFWPLVIVGVLSIPVFLFAFQMPKKTATGYALFRQTKGLAFYLSKGKWREEIKEKQLFLDEILPLAISLGVVSKLARDMQELGVKEPSYFAAHGAAWSSSFNSFNSSASTSMAPAKSSSGGWSGGSGFSGGSSGGGFGGGGGGSW
jgi:uncharacterized membrane protein